MPSLRILIIALIAMPTSAFALNRDEDHAIAEAITQCTDDHHQFFSTGLSRGQYLRFCDCYVRHAYAAVTPDEQAYRQQHDSPSPDYVRTAGQLVSACVQDARANLPD